MTILVTGGAGFIGSNFCLDWLAQSDEEVVNLDKLTYAGNLQNLASVAGNPHYHFVHGDFGDTELVARLLQEHQPRAVINFAAESHVDRSIHGPGEFIQTNIVGTFALLECVRAYWGAKTAADEAAFRFLHASTDEVYGSLSKTDATFTETNRSNNYCSYHFPEKLIPLMIVNAKAGKPLPVYGDGQQIRDWLYVKDHCSAIRRVLEAGRVGEVYNVGGWNEKPYLDIGHTVCALLDELKPRADGKPFKDQIAYVTDRPGHDRRYAVDARKIEQELGWKPAETFETGIRKTVQWYLDNPEWVANVQSGGYRDWVAKQYGQESAHA